MRTLALIKRICQQMLRDKRTLALMMVAPLLILTLVYFLFTGNSSANIRLGIVNSNAMITEQLQAMDIEVVDIAEPQDAAAVIRDNDLDGILQIDKSGIRLTLENADPSVSKGLQIKVQQAMSALAAKQQAAQAGSNSAALTDSVLPNVEMAYVFGNKDTSFFDVVSPVLVGFFVFFFVFLISGISLLRERTTGTLDRIVATPIRRSEIVLGYLSGYGIFAVIQTVIVVLYATKVLDIVLVGSIWNVILINLLLGLVALSLALLLSAFANTEFQMVQFIPIVAIPQVFFAGIFPVDGMADWLQVIARFMPMYYAGDALQGVMYKGEGISDISGDLLILVGFAALFIIMNILALKKYRKI
ncbi:ABC transporter permease [Paenibacillus marinisediminis]